MSTAPSSTTPPVATGAPVLGAALALRRDPLAAHERAMREHGDVVRFVAGPPGARISFVAVYNPDGVQRVMAAESARYRKDNRFYDEVRWAFGDGLLNSQDERWRRQRRFLQPLFTRPRIAEYVALFADEAGALVDRWAPVAARGGWVDLHGEMTALAVRMVARALFGTGAAAGSRHSTSLLIPPGVGTSSESTRAELDSSARGLHDVRRRARHRGVREE